MSYKDVIIRLDELCYEQILLLEAIENTETFEEYAQIVAELEMLDYEIEQLEIAYMKYN